MILVLPVKPGSWRSKRLPSPLPRSRVKPLPKPKRSDATPKRVPESCQYGPELPMDSIGVQARPGATYRFVEGHGWELVQPEPQPEIERPSKAEYLRAFEADCYRVGYMPPRVLRRWQALTKKIAGLMAFRESMPRRARRALDAYLLSDLWCAYDRGLLGRIGYYAEGHLERAYRAKYAC
jgi:hypothetical protein